MVESNAGKRAEQKPLSPQTKQDYQVYRAQVFEGLEQEADPLLVDTDVAELLFLVLKHPDFTQSERVEEFVVVAQLTMSRMCRYTHEPQGNPSIIQQAEMIHHTYAQLFAQSMLELSRLAEQHPHPPYV